MSRTRVVITGVGCISGLGKTVAETWKNVVDCRSAISPITTVDTTTVRFKNGADIKDYQPLDHFSPKQFDLIDKFSQFALIAARQAITDANIQWTEELKLRTCIITGSGIGGSDSIAEAFKSVYEEGKTRVPLFTIPKIMPNAGASHISMEFGIKGFAYTISTACASSNHALGHAFWSVRNGLADVAIAGGTETPFNLGFLKAWEAIRVVDEDTCRPFSKNRLGMILGEGGGMLVLEKMEDAIKRGAKIYAEVVGFGMSADAGHITKPDQSGPERAMKMALDDAGITPDKIDYINAHGTGTTVNDSLEVAAIKGVFGDHAKKMAVSSTKSLHGHILGGTSAVEAVITALALKNQLYPPTANFTEPDPECDIDVVPNASRAGEMNYALSNSFAFGGLNAVVAFRRWDDIV